MLLCKKNPLIPLLDSTGSPENVLLPGPHLGGTHHIWEAAGTALGGQKLFFFFFLDIFLSAKTTFQETLDEKMIL